MKPKPSPSRKKPDVYRTVCFVLAGLWVLALLCFIWIPTDANEDLQSLSQISLMSICLLPIVIITIIFIRLQDLRKMAEQPATLPMTQNFGTVDDADDVLASPEMTTLLQRLNTHFDESELRALCFDLRIEPENLPGETRQDLARELIRYMLRRGRAGELYAQCEALRPNELWRHPAARA